MIRLPEIPQPSTLQSWNRNIHRPVRSREGAKKSLTILSLTTGKQFAISCLSRVASLAAHSRNFNLWLSHLVVNDRLKISVSSAIRTNLTRVSRVTQRGELICPNLDRGRLRHSKLQLVTPISRMLSRSIPGGTIADLFPGRNRSKVFETNESTGSPFSRLLHDLILQGFLNI